MFSFLSGQITPLMQGLGLADVPEEKNPRTGEAQASDTDAPEPGPPLQPQEQAPMPGPPLQPREQAPLPGPPIQPHEEEPLCDYCEMAPGRFFCSDCKKERYCGKACQEKSWDTHIFYCTTTKKPKTYQHLAKAVYADLLPTNAQTLKDWGFDRAEHATDQHTHGPQRLFGLYAGLIKYLDVPAKTLDEWRKAGRLVDEIKKKYEPIPPSNRGQYYPWFLKNEFVLNTALPLPTNAMEDMVDQLVKKGWTYSGGSAQLSTSTIRARMNSMDPKKSECIILCGLLLDGGHPHPTQPQWLNFGFCVGGQYDEMSIGRAYQQLVASCTFQEFFTAYKECKLADLFKRKKIGLPSSYNSPSKEQFEDVLSGSGWGMFKSAWNLKQFVVLKTEDGDADIPLIRSVRFDYGFMNCAKDEEFRLLMKVYQEYFQLEQHNCIHLHNACIKGELFEYLGKFIKSPLTPTHRRLLKNMYPLPDI